MTVPSAELQDAVDSRLRAFPGVKAAMGLTIARLYDVAPTGAPYPHIIHGEDQLVDASAEGVEAYEAFIMIHVWTKTDPPSLKPAKQIAAQVVKALLSGLEISDYTVVEIEHQGTNTFSDLDEVSAHSVVTFRAIIEPAN